MKYVLIIEENDARAECLATICSRFGLSTRRSPDALHGVMQIVSDEPSLVLVDEQNVQVGSESIESQLRRHDNFSNIPVVVISRESRSMSVSNVANFGQCDFQESWGLRGFEQKARQALERVVIPNTTKFSWKTSWASA
jgi:DNA-binding NtrC family response regulator